jgi:hypothetical protein
MATRKTTRKTPRKATRQSGADAAPWDRDNPQGDKHQALSAKAKATAKRRAKKAGRPYPNLVDNMAAARKDKQ